MSFLLKDKTTWKGEGYVKWNVYTSTEYLRKKKVIEKGPGPAKRNHKGNKQPQFQFRLQTVDIEFNYDKGKISRMPVRDLFPDNERDGITNGINLNPKWHLIEFRLLTEFVEKI
ncbi:unnamed protein product [Zymoseptoria tritici ST99CH_3D1]|nr:unnamed protein product [Zymoseptoria tritici ST99CH_3D1]